MVYLVKYHKCCSHMTIADYFEYGDELLYDTGAKPKIV